MRAWLLIAWLSLTLAACGSSAPAKTTPAADTGATTDAGGTTEPDATSSDSTDTAAPDVAPTCPGAPDCPCTANADCNNALCIDTPAGKQCARPCVTDCPAGFACTGVTASGGDVATICVPRWLHLCDPCHTGKDCESLGLTGAACLSQGEAGSFCGSACATDADCPADHACSDATVGGKSGKHCQRKSDAGQCPCSPLAIATGASTACAASPGAPTTGKCAGSRTCTAEGLSLCSAASPTTEVCNGEDDDCNGQTDESSCDDKNTCTTDSCDGKACAHVAISGNCDADNNACTKGDACQSGVCVAGKVVDCDDQNPCTTDACDPKVGCTHAAEDGKPCDDDNPCTLGDTCAGEVCGSGKPKTCTSTDPCVLAKCCAHRPQTDPPIVGKLIHSGRLPRVAAEDRGWRSGDAQDGSSDGSAGQSRA